ncbi:unnamed protein product [Lymnaea stagnalis]|uniref:Uncharacterized protein n=1 Tax=Lymnaea stagnalis TaxID=6523 RepID=A0AAV2HGX7_LYMST
MSTKSGDTGIFTAKSKTPSPKIHPLPCSDPIGKPLACSDPQQKGSDIDKVSQWLNTQSGEEEGGSPTEPTRQVKSQAEQTEELKKVAPWAKDFIRRSFTYKYRFVDTHCNVDDLVEGLNRDTQFNAELQSLPDNYEGFIAVFSNPTTFSSQSPADQLLKAVLREEGIWIVLGCPPKHANRFRKPHLVGLKQALATKHVVGVGPCGLDYTVGVGPDVQKVIFKVQLEMAVELKLPLVIQCQNADDDCLAMLQQHVPKLQKIHLQGFTGGKSLASRWMASFPNVYFGLTSSIVDRTAPACVKDMVRAVPLERILLESGTVVPENFRKHVATTHFGFALFTAKAIGELRRVSTDEVFKTCRENTRLFYGV